MPSARSGLEGFPVDGFDEASFRESFNEAEDVVLVARLLREPGLGLEDGAAFTKEFDRSQGSFVDLEEAPYGWTPQERRFAGDAVDDGGPQGDAALRSGL